MSLGHGHPSAHIKFACRLYIDFPLISGKRYVCNNFQSNYLHNVLRLTAGADVLVFNGKEGEWHASLEILKKGECNLKILSPVRPHKVGPDIEFIFAPLKKLRLDYVVEKVVEMGVAKLRPAYTQHTAIDRVNAERMQTNVIEAAEQCGIMYVPKVEEPDKLFKILETWPASRPIIFCDEVASVTPPLEVLQNMDTKSVALLIGPEGGFEKDERAKLLSLPFVTPISLGPRILRADTAAVAALALVNSVLGDWR